MKYAFPCYKCQYKQSGSISKSNNLEKIYVDQNKSLKVNVLKSQ